MGIAVIPVAGVQAHARTARRARYARLGLQAGSGAAAFLLVYSVLQVLHTIGCDPSALGALASIPLFARFLGSACVAATLGTIIGFLAAEPERSLRKLPRTLAIAITLFVAVCVGLP